MDEANQENFQAKVLTAKGMVLVDFNADWCGPCQLQKPILEELVGEQDICKIVSVNIDQNAELAEQYQVSSIPCMVLFEDGQEVKRVIGLQPKKKLQKLLGIK